MERFLSRFLVFFNCTVVFGGVGRGMEGFVVKGWEGINFFVFKYGCIFFSRLIEFEWLVLRFCFFDL